MAKQVKNSPKKTQAIFEQMAKAMVTPMPKKQNKKAMENVTPDNLKKIGFERKADLKGDYYERNGHKIRFGEKGVIYGEPILDLEGLIVELNPPLERDKK